MDQNPKTYPVEVKSDFLQKLGRVAAATGLAEVIWNALDADAKVALCRGPVQRPGRHDARGPSARSEG